MLLTAASGMMLKNEMTNLTVAGQLTNLAIGFQQDMRVQGRPYVREPEENSKS